jgi:hypothetical protein
MTSTNVTTRNCALTFDELARRIGRRHLRDVLDQELELGRVNIVDGRYMLSSDLPRELVIAFRGIDGVAAMLEQRWPTR